MENKTFEASMNRLEEIVKLLEGNEQPLDDTIQLFSEGLSLVQQCDSQLKQFENKVEQLLTKKGETNETI